MPARVRQRGPPHPGTDTRCLAFTFQARGCRSFRQGIGPAQRQLSVDTEPNISQTKQPRRKTQECHTAKAPPTQSGRPISSQCRRAAPKTRWGRRAGHTKGGDQTSSHQRRATWKKQKPSQAGEKPFKKKRKLPVTFLEKKQRHCAHETRPGH